MNKKIALKNLIYNIITSIWKMFLLSILLTCYGILSLAFASNSKEPMYAFIIWAIILPLTLVLAIYLLEPFKLKKLVVLSSILFVISSFFMIWDNYIIMEKSFKTVIFGMIYCFNFYHSPSIIVACLILLGIKKYKTKHNKDQKIDDKF